MNEIKERNKAFLREITTTLAGWPQLVPVGQLSVFFHAANGLGFPWGKTHDKAERRNREYFESLNPRIEDVLTEAIISGSFKPADFIHPFESFHTTPGYMDISVLPDFFRTVDEIALEYRSAASSSHAEEFLSFTYMLMLLIHPFIDGNGRVARNLLDYYNTALHFGLPDVWNDRFSEKDFYKGAFRTFFLEEVNIAPCDEYDIHSARAISALLRKRKVEIGRLSEYLLSCATRIRNSRDYGSSPGIMTMARGIRDLQQAR